MAVRARILLISRDFTTAWRGVPAAATAAPDSTDKDLTTAQKAFIDVIV
jgi:hypothetical protein